MDWVVIVVVGLVAIWVIYTCLRLCVIISCARFIEENLIDPPDFAIISELTLWQLTVVRQQLSGNPLNAYNWADIARSGPFSAFELLWCRPAGLLSVIAFRPKAEKCLISLAFWIPRKYREAITGDILEDCREMREKGFSERRIRVHVLWQLAIAVIALWPEAVGSAVAAIVQRVWKTKQ